MMVSVISHVCENFQARSLSCNLGSNYNTKTAKTTFKLLLALFKNDYI
jgi:hypothetical protein